MLKLDCRYFKGDRPCAYHKETCIIFNDCSYYNPVGFKILIIKLDAMGDVLRTTTILHPLKSKYKGSQITWCTKNDSAEFLHNAFIDEVIVYENDTALRLLCEKYDLVINLDSSKKSIALTTIAKGGIKKGLYLMRRDL